MTFYSPWRAILLALPLVAWTVAGAQALQQLPYNEAAFKAAQAAGQPAVVHVTAPWCPTCKAQHASIESLAKDPAFDSITIYQVDFDTQADIWKSFGARSQSTLVAFKGSGETGRLVGETGAAPIEKLLRSTLAQ